MGNKREAELPKPLEILIVSDDNTYKEVARKYFSGCTTDEGSTLFDIVAAVTKKELDDSLTPEENGTLASIHKADINLFDLRGSKLTDLQLLNKYLSRNKKSYSVVSVTDEQWVELDNVSMWGNLQRDAIGTGVSLTTSLRVQSKKKLTEDDYRTYFNKVYTETLTPNILSVIREIKADSINTHRRIANLPNEFSSFSKRVRNEYTSKLITRSLDLIAGFKPDETIKVLKELQPSGDKGYSIPQHCYPSFEKLDSLSQEQIFPHLLEQGNKPLSFYIHIPFCVTSCAYCDYTTLTKINERVQREYLDLLKKEMQIIYDSTGWKALSPRGIHIGGGTPSILSPELIRELGNFLKGYLNLQENFQLTFEVSPETVTPEKLDAFKSIGAKRSSAGLQCVADEVLLSWVDRWIYTQKKGKRAVELLLERWPKDTNIDMMYGLPGQTVDSWEKDLNAALELKVPSITFYNLRVSPRTRFVKEQEFPKIYERMLMFAMATERFLEDGFIQSSDNQVVMPREDQPYVYKESKKRGGNTLGIGISSYSLFPGVIYFNNGGRDNRDPENLNNYSKAVKEGKLPVEIGKILSKKEQIALFMTQGLKLSGLNKEANGVDSTEFERRFGISIQNAFPHTEKLLEHGLIEKKGDYLGLTYKGLAFEELTIKTYWKYVNTA